IDRTVPAAIRDTGLDLPAPIGERDAAAELAGLAADNEVATSLVGLGYHGTITPPAIRRRILENPAWYTAYTPYQPEISQGRLEMLVNFQTMVSDLVGMPITNASLLDEGTAAAEAMTLLHRQTKGRRGDRFLVDADCHPQTIAVVETRAEPLGLEVVVGDPAEVDESHFGVLVQYPGSSGRLRPLRPIVEAAHGAGALVAVAADLLACTLVEPPGEAGADVVVGSSQRFGVPMGFGGPHAAFMSVRDEAKRSLPGRLVGASIDTEGRTAYRLALATREQHIRREKATSNICTAQVLLAIIAAAYAQYHGPDGLRAMAERVHGAAARVAAAFRAAGHEVVWDDFFDTITVRVPGRADEVVAEARAFGFDLRPVDDDTVGLTFDETTDEDVVERLAGALDLELPAEAPSAIPEGLRRTSDYLTHPSFNRYHSETELIRYLRSLSDKDIALDRAMIPLGSCTMKLNAAAAMEPISWPAFADLHPYGPEDRAAGYDSLARDLEQWLAEITGYDAVSLQPNSGAQGEYAGLLAIRGWHRSRGEHRRDVCLIPASAHGTNPASAAMAGMSVVVVKTDEDGNVDVGDLREKLDEHGERVAALMVTYPSTHGVFEEAIVEVCELVHAAGGQVYMDGANLNAMVGVAKPGRFGADVGHLNLHKTFTIPHGGGGPGVGPIGVRAHLAPFLPGAGTVGPVASAPLGSAGILPIPWMYIRMMGADGLRRASEVAILSANYVAARLDEHYDVLYRGSAGFVAHECIIDLRPITAETGVTVDDLAKRLIDYGFHAPTMSFPVAGTLMIEPTESEPLSELDRFCDAMIAIRAEIDEVGRGEVALEDSVLRHAPHTAEDLLVGEWRRPYTRETAAYPDPAVKAHKYWPPVSRIDQGYGDRHLVCTCPPMEAWE
ncbi:MAG: aminomethyl-transferring glycine dehydrogenase, partial [Acidimicrobiia bacterium]